MKHFYRILFITMSLFNIIIVSSKLTMKINVLLRNNEIPAHVSQLVRKTLERRRVESESGERGQEENQNEEHISVRSSHDHG